MGEEPRRAKPEQYLLNYIANGPLAEEGIYVLFHGLLEGAVEIDVQLAVS